MKKMKSRLKNKATSHQRGEHGTSVISRKSRISGKPGISVLTGQHPELKNS